MTTTRPSSPRQRLTGLQSLLYEHPADQSLLRVLKAVPGAGTVIGKVIDLIKREEEVRLLANAVAVTPRTMPTMYARFQEACDILDLPRPWPKFFVELGLPNAYTTGADEPYVVVTTDLAERCDPDELSFVIGHELGHVQAGHVRYHMLARFLMLSTRYGLLGGGLTGLLADITFGPALYAWVRRSEFTADRAGFLAVQDRDAAFRAMLKLAGWPAHLAHEIRPDALLEQYGHYQERLGTSWWDRVIDLKNHVGMDHPYWTARAAELQDWIDEGSAPDIIDANDDQRKRMLAHVDRDPQGRLLSTAVVRALTAWAASEYSLERSQAASIVRHMIYDRQAPDGTPLAVLLRVELQLSRVNAEQVRCQAQVLVNRGGRAVVVTVPVSFDSDWESLPGELRREWLHKGGQDLVRLLYSA